MESKYKKPIIAEINKHKLSPSHDLFHLKQALKYAKKLHEIYGGDWDVINAAVLLHDLGRSDPILDDEESIASSISKARPILEYIEFPVRKVDDVLIAIEDHDKPEFTPRTLEGRILKDADFLAGFGAWGILRIAMWIGETRGGVSKFLETVEDHMPDRINGLEFPESKLSAQREYIFAKLFTNLLCEEPEIHKPYRGKYIILEGNGGVGKTTQAELLIRRLRRDGKSAIKVQEPSPIFRMIEELWKNKYKDELRDDGTLFRRYLIVGDRDKNIQETILPALKNGSFVVSDRSFLSMLVYQCNNEFDRLFTSFVHSFQPTPDLIILYDADENLCYERMITRKEIGPFDELEELKRYRPIFLKVATSDYFGCPVEVIDSSGTIDEVADATWQILIDNKIIDY